MQEEDEAERLAMINGMSLTGGGGGGEASFSDEYIRAIKAEISSHLLYQKLLSIHINCLYVATHTDHRHTIDAQITTHSHLHHTVIHSRSTLSQHEKQELDTFMAEYLMLLSSLKDQLERHVKCDAYEAVVACRQIENSLQALTGVTLGETNGATMSDDEDEYTDLQLDNNHHQSCNDIGQDMMMGFGLPNESERTLMERVRQELKIELKQGFKSRIEDVREEIMRKRRAGKLPSDTTLVLKNWWQQHSSWPYPTEDDKAKLVEETGLQLKQINNWFINQRKRNWHAASQSVTSLKSKRKR